MTPSIRVKFMAVATVTVTVHCDGHGVLCHGERKLVCVSQNAATSWWLQLEVVLGLTQGIGDIRLPPSAPAGPGLSMSWSGPPPQR